MLAEHIAREAGMPRGLNNKQSMHINSEQCDVNTMSPP